FRRVQGAPGDIMSAMPIGVSMMPLANRHDTLIDVATTAERLGYDSYFLPETWAYDVTVLMAEAAFRTQRLMLGTGILGVWGRSAGTLAMGAASLAEASGGRFVLGLGASTAQLTEGLHDVPFVAPLARMRRTVMQVRALLRGERVPLGVVRVVLSHGDGAALSALARSPGIRPRDRSGARRQYSALRRRGSAGSRGAAGGADRVRHPSPSPRASRAMARRRRRHAAGVHQAEPRAGRDRAHAERLRADARIRKSS